MYGKQNGARIRRVQYIRSFEQAKLRFESIKPIRGRSDQTIRPLLPDRTNTDTFSIRKKEHDGKVSYECWLYRTPVLKYNEDGTIVIQLDTWNSQSTRTFITEVLGFECSTKNGHAYIVVNGDKVVLPKVGPTVVRPLADGKWELVISARVSEIQLKRKEANAVRARYKPFIDYVNNMVNLRKETVTKYGEDDDYVVMQFTEFAEKLGSVPEWALNWRWLGDKLSFADQHKDLDKIFFKLIAADEDGSFYTAFLLMIASMYDLRPMNTGFMPQTIFVLTSRIPKKLKEVLYKYHSDEVFEEVELPVGEVPSNTYNNWV